MVEKSSVLKLAAAIQTQEGWAPGTLAYRNNNPGNLRYVGQQGATPGAGGFASFGSYSDGLAALVAQIQLDAVRGTDAAGRPVVTVSDLIHSWAPPSENDTGAYVASIERQTGFSGSDVLNSLGGGADYSGGGGLTDLNGDGTGDDSGGVSAGLNLPGVSLAAIGVVGASVLWLALRH